MKNLKDIITEKLIINRNNIKANINSIDVLEEILSYLPHQLNKMKFWQPIAEWIRAQEISDFKICADKETYDALSRNDVIKSEYLKKYDTSYETIEQCENDILLNQHPVVDDDFAIYVNDKEVMICGWFGEIYIVQI